MTPEKWRADYTREHAVRNKFLALFFSSCQARPDLVWAAGASPNHILQALIEDGHFEGNEEND